MRIRDFAPRHRQGPFACSFPPVRSFSVHHLVTSSRSEIPISLVPDRLGDDATLCVYSIVKLILIPDTRMVQAKDCFPWVGVDTQVSLISQNSPNESTSPSSTYRRHSTVHVHRYDTSTNITRNPHVSQLHPPLWLLACAPWGPQVHFQSTEPSPPSYLPFDPLACLPSPSPSSSNLPSLSVLGSTMFTSCDLVLVS